MSRDIRSYFTSPNAQKPSTKVKPSKGGKKPLISSDEEDSHGSNSPPKNKAKSSKKAVKHVLSDSEEEDVPKKSKNDSAKSQNKSKKEEEKLKPVSIDNIFGKGKPIERKNAPSTTNKTSKQKSEFDDDDDFEATLSNIDTKAIDSLYKTDVETKTSGKRKPPSSSEDDTPSKKLKITNGDKGIAVKKEKENKKSSPSSSSSSSSKSKLDITVEKKKPKAKDLDETPDPFEESIVKKKQHAAAYQQYLHRGGARNPGSKTIPEGAENCLAGLTFVVTGVLESLERHEIDELIKKYGGRIVAAVSKKTNYLVVGDEAGESKLSKAAGLGIKKISEDDLLELIRTRPEGKASAVIQSKNKKRDQSPKKVTPEKIISPVKSKKQSPAKSPEKKEEKIKNGSPVKEKNKSPVKNKSPDKNLSSRSLSEMKPATSKNNSPGAGMNSLTKSKSEMKPPPSKISSEVESSKTPPKSGSEDSFAGEAQALVEKYRPKTMKQIIGQHTDKSSARKLHLWLMNWHKNQSGKVKHTKPSPWAKNDDGAFFKAALLSGPPGVGKTTTVQVVCNELGYDLVEFNASDTRSKRLLKEDVSTLLSNTSVKGYFSTGGSSKTSTKHVLLMDEVDGMAGNEDRGGLQELINLIKSTDIPIVCICNDRNHPKMRTLSNYTFDLRFNKPKLEQIRGAMKSLCCKEGINISTDNLDRLIQSTNFDIRQVINHLAILSSGVVRKEGEEDKERISDRINKDLKLGPWDVCRKVFSADEHQKMTIHDKSDLFFHDYNIAGLFVQENYLSVVPKAPKNELLDRVAAAAESLALGDVVEKAIRSGSSWSLLPAQACYSSVIPGSVMSGYITSQINFPAWLGRNSKRTKFDRLLQEITVHTRLVTGASKEAINIDYLVPLRDKITRPLIADGSDGVEAAVDAMNHYHLLREDLDGLVETSLWPGQKDPMQSVESKVKAAFTRLYNKNSTMTPFAMGTSKKKDVQPSQDEGFITGEGEEDVESDKDEDDLEVDRMVKAKKPAAEKNTASTSKGSKGREKPASKRGRGRGK